MNMFKTTEANTAEEYIEMLEGARKSEIQKIHELILKTVPKLKPFIISGMIGYGKYHYKSKTREGEWATILLASQKNYISLYFCIRTRCSCRSDKRRVWRPATGLQGDGRFTYRHWVLVW